jgi:hypothetical protein
MIPKILSPGQQHENNKTLAIIILLISVLIIDTSLFRISDLIRVYVTPIWATSLFVFMSIVYLLGQHILIRSARTKSRQIRELGYLHLKVLDKSVTIIQYLLSGIIVFVLLQVVIFSEFYTSAVSMAAVISYHGYFHDDISQPAILFLVQVAQESSSSILLALDYCAYY